MQYPRPAAHPSHLAFLLAIPLFLAAGCPGNSPQTDSGSGGSAETGGAGGKAGTGGNTDTGGGKASGTGGTSTGGDSGGHGSGGSPATGGNPGGHNGGAAGTGDKAGAGGAAGARGGASGSAGSAGSSSTGGASGGNSGGGAVGSGGTTSAGGQTGGGTGGGSGSGLCSSAFFSTDAAGRKAAEYSSWKATYVQDCASNNSAVVKNGGGVYSEGIGYGMLLAANNNDQALFDKLWKFYSDHLDPNGLMNWSMDACAAPDNNNANGATDGDLDATLGLVIADKVWGGYKSKAQEMIGKIKKFETDTCSNGMVVLRPGDKYGGCTESATRGKVNPSYFAPGHYRAFATIDTANADFWKQLASDSYKLLDQYQTTMNGLVPEWGFSDGSIESSNYDYNACRTPWRVAMDFMWYCTPEAKTVLEKFSKFIDGKGGVAKTGYPNNSAFVGAFADSGIAISQAKIDSYVSDWMGNSSMDDAPYFQGTLRRLYLLVAGGQMLSGL